jgi:DNA-binding XRE family transcriptional regulator
MISEKVTIDLSDLRENESRETVKRLFQEYQIYFKETVDFWSNFESGENEISQNTLVFSELHSFINHSQSIDALKWAYKVKKMNPYFVAIISGKKDLKFAHLIDDLTKRSSSRITVFNGLRLFDTKSHKIRFITEINKIILRNYNPEAIKFVSVNKKNSSFLLEFIDGLYGEVTFMDLEIEDIANNLLLDSVQISDLGNAIELFTNDGELFDIDSQVLRLLISKQTKDEIAHQTELTALNVGKKIASARKNSNLTQVDLSKLTDIDQAILSKIETGKHLPRFDTLERIANGIGVSLNELLQAH